MSTKEDFHPAQGVNIKNYIPLTLDMDTVQYSNWSELFESHTIAFNLHYHINPSSPRPSDLSDSMFQRLDNIVKTWIYNTVSPSLLNTILVKGSTAQKTWDRLRNIFQDNKATRAVHLDTQFNTLHVSAFANISEYCARIKNIADQLANLDQPVEDSKLVIRLIAGLHKSDFDTVAAMIQQTVPLPSFEVA